MLSPRTTTSSADLEAIVGQHRLQRVQVRMDVCDRGDGHRCYEAVTSAACRCGAPGSRGPAQTTSSAGQPAHVNSLGVGENSAARMPAIASESSASRAGSSARSKL